MTVPEAAPGPSPNAWLKAVLARPMTRPELLAWVVYHKMAEYFGSCFEGYFGPIPCWASSLGEVEDICDPAFKGLFLTQKGGLGYLSRGHIIRFHKEVAFLGTLEATIEGIGVKLVGVGRDAQGYIVFIVSEDCLGQFGVPEHIVAEELGHLRQRGAMVMSVKEVLRSFNPIEVVWTVPEQQQDPNEPEAVESWRPGGPDQRPPEAVDWVL